MFKLAGSKLTAYHETTHQPRATINLAKASKLVDDKTSLMKKEASKNGGGRRKSAFAEEEEGYMFVEEGFRIRFANGEVIDFYANSAAEKSDWMKALSEVVGKQVSSSQSKPWVDMVLKRERSVAAKEGRPPRSIQPTLDARKMMSRENMQDQNTLRAAPSQRASVTSATPPAIERPFSSRSAIPLPTPPNQSPEKAVAARPLPGPRPSHARTESYQPASGSASRSQPGSPVKGRLGIEPRHQKARSMIGMQWH